MKNQISKREQEVLHLIAHENSTKMIARELYISEHTVISHRKNLMMKLNASNTAGLVRRAYEAGFLKLSRQVAVLCFLLFSVSCVYAQHEFSMDTSGMAVLNDTDTIFTIDSKIESRVNIRLSKSDTSGAVLIRALDNPSIRLFDKEQNESLAIFSHFGSSVGERNPRIDLRHHDENGDVVSTLQLRANHNGTNDSRVITDEIEIKGGSDLAELFDITTPENLISPGMIVSLDAEHPGKLILSSQAYDKKVAGVISGANGIKPGILMGQDETIATGDDLVTLSGRTYVKANTSNGNIKVGDLITTSDVPGEAMKAKHKRKSQGAIIGKAMTPLTGENGYVLVLVNLQ